MKNVFLLSIALGPLFFLAMMPDAVSAEGDATEEYKLVIKDHKFSPDRLEIPAGKKIKLIVDNQDSTPEEFESHDFKREKIIRGNSSAPVFVGPLEPGEYKFFGEFNMETAKGVLVAK